jgi:hypothetical protein
MLAGLVARDGVTDVLLSLEVGGESPEPDPARTEGLPGESAVKLRGTACRRRRPRAGELRCGVSVAPAGAGARR